MSDSWNNMKAVCCKPWLVLPTVYSDALSYGEQLDKFCYSLNKLIENNNILPEYIADKIKEYISSGAIGEVVREILANYILNVKYPPKGITPAVGDGSADDTEAIQGCIDYAAENGGVVYFPYGSYLTQPLTMKDGVSLFGFDRYSTKVVLKGGATKALLNGNASNLSVCNLTLDGNSGIQVNDVNVVDMTGSNLMFNDLVIRDGYKLFEFVGDGHLQLSNIVFGNAVENCFSVNGNVIVQTKNLLFTALSKVGGVSVVDIKANGGNYDFNSVAKCDTCMLISGNDNKVVAMIGGAAEDYVDTGEHNNVEIVGHSQKEYYSGDVKKDANNSETTLQGTRSLHVVGASTFAVDGNSTESVDGNKSEIVTGVTTETYKNTKTVNLTNEDKTLTGKKTTSANSLEENVTGKKTTNSDSTEEVVSNDKTTSAKNLTENLTGDKTVNANAMHINAPTDCNKTATVGETDRNSYEQYIKGSSAISTIDGLNPDGNIGVLGASNTGNIDSETEQYPIGTMGVAIANNPNNKSTVSAGYFHIIREEGTIGGSVGVEVDNDIQVTTQDITPNTQADPKQNFASGLTLSSGGGDHSSGKSKPLSTAILINDNPSAFKHGLVIREGSVTEEAICLPSNNGHRIAWWNDPTISQEFRPIVYVEGIDDNSYGNLRIGFWNATEQKYIVKTINKNTPDKMVKAKVIQITTTFAANTTTIVDFANYLDEGYTGIALTGLGTNDSDNKLFVTSVSADGAFIYNSGEAFTGTVFATLIEG